MYSTLNELTQMGELLELGLDGRSKRYDPNIAPAHHHLVCDSCSEVFDVQHEVPAPALTDDEAHGMTVNRAEIGYHGIRGS